MTTRLLLPLAALFLLGFSTAHAQTAPLKHWVHFTSKTSPPAGYDPTPYDLSNPSAFLSERALARRAAQGIGLSEDDLPVPPSYLSALLEVEGVVDILVTSKWLNAATVQVADSSFDPATLEALPFVLEVRSVATAPVPREPEAMDHNRMLDTTAYGAGWLPLAQMGGDHLHEQGYLGAGRWIAVIDAGFEFVDVLPVFETARSEGRIHEGLDAMHSPTVYDHHRHGTYVLGTMAGNLQDSLIGTAPAADYFLYRSEDAYTEYLIEEDYWIYAAEHADSIGVDLINTSLGYSLFDDPDMNHTHEDLDGLTTNISIGMTMAADRGILCVTSAGNSGASAWHKITAPADAHGILAVGAVHASGSGFGPSADGRVKPDVMALGVAAGFPWPDSTIHFGNGTSFASPILCGLAACLWEAHPDATSAEVREAIIASASLFTMPNDSMGHGIPNFQIADNLLSTIGIEPEEMRSVTDRALVYPNPSRGAFQVVATTNVEEASWRLIDVLGREVESGVMSLSPCGARGMTQCGDIKTAHQLAGRFHLEIRSLSGDFIARQTIQFIH
jgi:serine protease AprX